MRWLAMFLIPLFPACGGGGGSSPPTSVTLPDVFQTALVGQTLSLDGATVTGTPGPLSFNWVLTARPAGSSANLVAPDTAQPSFSPDRAGAYLFSLVASNGVGANTNVTVSVTAYSVAASRPLNDTGVDRYADEVTLPTMTAEPAAYPGQDAGAGRDAQARASALTKIGGGGKAFDFTKIANDGTPVSESTELGAASGDWGCTRDNRTDLTWEVKTSGGFRSMFDTFTWFSSDAGNNAGDPGVADGGACSSVGRCDTEKYAADVNLAALCGFNDWRLPTRNELVSIVDYGRVDSAIDPTYFPNTGVSFPNFGFWTSMPRVNDTLKAWAIDANSGLADVTARTNAFSVRLVRGPR